MSRPKHRNAVRKLGENETIIYNALKTSDPTEMLRVQFQHHQGKAGYAIEVTRDVLGEPYVYTGWFSIKAFKTDPWPADQRHMIDMVGSVLSEAVLSRSVLSEAVLSRSV